MYLAIQTSIAPKWYRGELTDLEHEADVENPRNSVTYGRSSVVTIDLTSLLLKELYAMWRTTGSDISFRTFELRLQNEIIEKLVALDDIFGMLDELKPEQRAIFEESIERRELF